MTPRRLVYLCLALAGVVAAILQTEAMRARSPNLRSRQFQRLVGGLGWGCELDASRCLAAFDPRLSGVCGYETAPLPGGQAYCPYHGHRSPAAQGLLVAPPDAHPAAGAADEVHHD